VFAGSIQRLIEGRIQLPMSIYEKWILPRLVDVAMRNKEATRYRSRIVPKARGTVLEIGVGSGLNLPFYGSSVEQYYGLDPSEELLVMARKKASTIAFPIEFLAHKSEEIPLEDGCIDTVVTTWTLCSIPDPAKALKEMKRVLKPGGVMLFAEHGLYRHVDHSLFVHDDYCEAGSRLLRQQRG
jgi:SAM-dependent methyltransferase